MHDNFKKSIPKTRDSKAGKLASKLNTLKLPIRDCSIQFGSSWSSNHPALGSQKRMLSPNQKTPSICYSHGTDSWKTRVVMNSVVSLSYPTLLGLCAFLRILCCSIYIWPPSNLPIAGLKLVHDWKNRCPIWISDFFHILENMNSSEFMALLLYRRVSIRTIK